MSKDNSAFDWRSCSTEWGRWAPRRRRTSWCLWAHGCIRLHPKLCPKSSWLSCRVITKVQKISLFLIWELKNPCADKLLHIFHDNASSSLSNIGLWRVSFKLTETAIFKNKLERTNSPCRRFRPCRSPGKTGGKRSMHIWQDWKIKQKSKQTSDGKQQKWTSLVQEFITFITVIKTAWSKSFPQFELSTPDL